MANIEQLECLNRYNEEEEARCPYPTGICKVNLYTLESNITKLRTFANAKSKKKLKFLLPVKGNGYGSGMLPIAEFVENKHLCDYLGVAHLGEAYELKRINIQIPILILGQSFLKPSHITFIVKNNIEQTVSDIKLLRALETEGRQQQKMVNIHFKIDTGMGRCGVLMHDVPAFINEIKNCKNIHLVGVMTHFPVADAQNSEQFEYTEQQIAIFDKLRMQILAKIGGSDIVFHAANSGGTIEHPSSLFDMIRPGIATYGYPEQYGNGLSLGLQPIMQITTQISLIKTYTRGYSIGYGKTYITKKIERIAIVPIGYADGLNRRLGNRLTPIVNGKKVQSVGRISMDQFSILIDEQTKLNDKVIIIGANREYFQTAYDIACQAETITYEILCGLGNAKRMRHEYHYKRE